MGVTYTQDQVDAAMCLWEATLDLLGRPGVLQEKLREMFENHGASTMRMIMLDLIDDCEKAWQAAQERYGASLRKATFEPDTHGWQAANDADPGAFDWDFCPAFIESCLITDRLQQAVDKQYQP